MFCVENTTKSVSYFYPTSPNAARFQLPKGGFTVELGSRSVSAHATEEEALQVARQMPNPWCPCFLAFNPQP